MLDYIGINMVNANMLDTLYLCFEKQQLNLLPWVLPRPLNNLWPFGLIWSGPRRRRPCNRDDPWDQNAEASNMCRKIFWDLRNWQINRWTNRWTIFFKYSSLVKLRPNRPNEWTNKNTVHPCQPEIHSKSERSSRMWATLSMVHQHVPGAHCNQNWL